MKRTYTLFQQYVAYVLLHSFFLQSCGGLGNPITPIKKGPATFIQTHAQAIILSNNMAPLVDQEIIAQEGHLVTCYQEDGKLKANVKMNAPQGFSKTYQGAEVLLEQGADVSRLYSKT
jgi:hypothetical protein